jgi:hypothetical protein
MEHCSDPIYPGPSESGESDRVLFLGPDQRGVPLEVLAIEFPEGELLVIHVMRLRGKYHEEYERVMEWLRRS